MFRRCAAGGGECRAIYVLRLRGWREDRVVLVFRRRCTAGV